MHIKKQRRCVSCRQPHLQEEMLRIAKIGGKFVLDAKQKLGGRGAYVCLNKDCISLCIKKKQLNRAFKTNVDAEIYSALGEYEKNC